MKEENKEGKKMKIRRKKIVDLWRRQ